MSDQPNIVPPPGQPIPHALEEIAKPGPWGGSTFAYRGARIECLPGDHVCGMFLDGHPLSSCSFGSPGTITPLVDLWLDKRQLPGYMRQPGDAR